jgi:hypothetical protein
VHATRARAGGERRVVGRSLGPPPNEPRRSALVFLRIGSGRTRLRALSVALLVGLAAREVHAKWGDDLDPAQAPTLLTSVRPDLAAIVRAPKEKRAALVQAFVESKADGAIEAVKRFRNPELLPLFHALLHHTDWHVAHRALLALERMDDGSAVGEAFALLSHAEPRLREKAAISCLTLWDKPGAAVPADAAEAVATLEARERDPYVRSCLASLARRIARGQVVEQVSDEVRVTGDDGLVWTPILNGMNRAPSAAPGFVANRVVRDTERTASALPVAPRWTVPLLDGGARYSRDELPRGHRLQPFGFLRNDGHTYHTGQDTGAFFDGSGFYACAQGIVKLVYTGSDMGTLIVVEHRRTETDLVTVLFMHAAGVVFTKAGDRVVAGQLLGSMGLGFSFENGGHFAHMHLGVYPGPFASGHNYGYSPVEWGLSDWYDPVVVLADWVERTKPPVDDVGPAHPSLAPVVVLVREGKYADALTFVEAALAGALIDAAAKADARRIRDALRDAGPAVVRRATARRESGFPSRGRALLGQHAAYLDGLPHGDEPAKAATAWDAEPAFARDLEAERLFDAAIETERGLLSRHERKNVVELWEGLQDRLALTCLAMRVQAKLAASVEK